MKGKTMKRTELTHAEELKARRFRASVLKEDGLGCKAEGEFFYRTARGARAFVTREFDAWCETQRVEFDMGAEDWEEVWRDYTMIIASVKNEEGVQAFFTAKVYDKENPSEKERVYGMDADFTEEGQKAAAECFEVQERRGAEENGNH